jgi:DNA-binding HxlR family transcriptional regulator
MSKRARKPTSGCPIDFGLDIFGDRWTLLVIRDLLFAGKRHFKELMTAPEAIASNILAARLKKLEQRGLISRAPDPDNKKQVVYQLTAMGRDLTPIMVELIRFGGKYDPNTPVPGWFVARSAPDHEAMVGEVRRAMAEAHAKMPAAGAVTARTAKRGSLHGASRKHPTGARR